MVAKTKLINSNCKVAVGRSSLASVYCFPAHMCFGFSCVILRVWRFSSASFCSEFLVEGFSLGCCGLFNFVGLSIYQSGFTVYTFTAEGIGFKI